MLTKAAEESIRVIVADDHPLVRVGMKRTLDAEPDVSVIHEAATGDEVRAQLQTDSPHVLVMDLVMPEGGAAAIGEFRQMVPDLRVLVVSGYYEAEYVRGAISAGASGYVVKSSESGELVYAVRAVASGRTFFSLPLDSGSAAWLLTPTPQELPRDERLDLLSERERQVLQMIAEGRTNREVGENLGISVKTVETYRLRVCEKLALGSRVDMVRFALNAGLLA